MVVLIIKYQSVKTIVYKLWKVSLMFIQIGCVMGGPN